VKSKSLKKPPKKSTGRKRGSSVANGQTTRAVALEREGGLDAEPGVAPAAPFILTPTANTYVMPGTDLFVQMETNRTDLSYIVELSDITSGLPPVRLNVTPNGSLFAVTFLATHFAAGHLYALRVYVDPASGATPPHMDHTINTHTQEPDGWVIVHEVVQHNGSED